MLLQLAVGDAYGAGFEYADAAMVLQYNNLSRYVQHPRHRLKPGSYTDDTQMSLAIAETIVAGEPWVPEVLASRFVATFKRDPREGYASRFYQFLLRVRNGEEFLEQMQPAKAQLQTFFCLILVGTACALELFWAKAQLQTFFCLILVGTACALELFWAKAQLQTFFCLILG
jgi:hypothetical protein